MLLLLFCLLFLTLFESSISFNTFSSHPLKFGVSFYDCMPTNKRCSSLKSSIMNVPDANRIHATREKTFLAAIVERITLFFPMWVLSFSLIGFKLPFLFEWFSPFITPALALTMAGMGMTLSYKDFAQLIPNWRFILIGFVAQYSVMPISAFYISRAMQLSSELATGLILVGCAPGGTASNLVRILIPTFRSWNKFRGHLGYSNCGRRFGPIDLNDDSLHHRRCVYDAVPCVQASR